MDIKLEAQSICSALEKCEKEDMIDVHAREISMFDMVPPVTIVEEQQRTLYVSMWLKAFNPNHLQ